MKMYSKNHKRDNLLCCNVREVHGFCERFTLSPSRRVADLHQLMTCFIGRLVILTLQTAAAVTSADWRQSVNHHLHWYRQLTKRERTPKSTK